MKGQLEQTESSVSHFPVLQATCHFLGVKSENTFKLFVCQQTSLPEKHRVQKQGASGGLLRDFRRASGAPGNTKSARQSTTKVPNRNRLELDGHA